MTADKALLREERWQKIQPLLPKFKGSRNGGRKPVGNQPVFEGIPWILRTGARWKDLPKQHPSPNHLLACEGQGVWLKVWL